MANMGKVARSFLTAFVVSIFFADFGWAGPIEDFRTAYSALDRGDYATALRLFRSLAAQDMSGAKWALGGMYFEGRGVPRDYNAALKWHRQAADQGHPLSQYEIGAMYERGLGVRKDYGEAAKWFRRSAEQGYCKAQLNLGAMYSVGDGVPQDLGESYKWFSLAAAGGGYLDSKLCEPVKRDAAGRRDKIAQRMTPAQLATAVRQVIEWEPKTENIALSGALAIANVEISTLEVAKKLLKEIQHVLIVHDTRENVLKKRVAARLLFCAAHYKKIAESKKLDTNKRKRYIFAHDVFYKLVNFLVDDTDPRNLDAFLNKKRREHIRMLTRNDKKEVFYFVRSCQSFSRLSDIENAIIELKL